MQVSLIGLDHKNAPVEIRERFAVDNTRYAEFNTKLKLHGSVFEHVVLSTCNRTEIYLVSEIHAGVDVVDYVMSIFSEWSKFQIDICQKHLTVQQNEDAIQHLFAVATGVESMVLGETEILGQVKNAYLKAHELGYTRKILNQLFQKALKVGKESRAKTLIGQGRVSVASIAVDLAKKIFLKLENKKILLIGSGEVSRQVCQALADSGARDLVIANRNQERAEALVHEFGGIAIPFSALDEWAGQVDIVIGSAGAPKAFIDSERVSRWVKSHHRKGIFLIDLGLPRNIEDSVNELEDVYLYNLDDLTEIADQNIMNRQRAIAECEKIISKALCVYLDWFQREVSRRNSWNYKKKLSNDYH